LIGDLIAKLTKTAEMAAAHAVRLRIAGNTHLAVSCESEVRTLINVILDLKQLDPAPTEDHHCFAGPIIEDRCAVCGRELP
jgi:hypothetical protein